MGNRNNFNISPGRITALWQLLRLSYRYEIKNNFISAHAAIEILLNSCLRGGGLPVMDGLTIGLYHKFLEIDKQGNLLPTEFSKSFLLSIHNGDEPNVFVQRQIIQKLISLKKEHWLIYFDEDIEVFKVAIPLNWLEILENARLFELNDREVVQWWKELIQKKEVYNQERRNEIGEVGEELTKTYEIDRLRSDSIVNSELYVIQVSKISDLFGFDIQSLRGNQFFVSRGLKEQIQIEVKSSIVENEELFTFYVSRNEWNKAVESIDLNTYFFYCWTGVNVNLRTGKGPYVIPAKKLQPLIPNDSSNLCEWWVCKFNLNLKAVSLI